MPVSRIFTGIPLMVSVVALCPFVSAHAQQPSAREKELEELVRRLSDKVDQLESRLGQLEKSKAGRPATPSESTKATEKRVEQLEKSIAEIKKEGRQVSSEEWLKIRKWVDQGSTLRPYWKDALHFDSNDGSVKLKIGGRIQNDYTYFVEDGDLERRLGSDFEDGTEFRRARLYFSGTIYDDIEFKAQYDFAGGDADFKDLYIGMKNVPYVGNIRIGQFKEPFSLEELTSSNYITFLERSLVNVFAPGRNVGVMIHDTMLNKRMSWAAGIFRQTDSFGNGVDGVGGRAIDVTARVTGLPWYEENGKKLLHLGLGFAHRNFRDDTVRFRARPEAHLSARTIDTGKFTAEFGDFVDAEAALVYGPFSLQGEFVQSFIETRNRSRIDNPNFWGATVQASYFLTGEHRPYKTSSGTFSRVKPLRNFRQDGGWGAWELAARFSYLDLSDGGVRSGHQEDVTLGVNWYLNPNVRTMWNYVVANPSKGGDLNIFLWRFQIAF